jgi:hypothetical protein
MSLFFPNVLVYRVDPHVSVPYPKMKDVIWDNPPWSSNYMVGSAGKIRRFGTVTGRAFCNGK